MWTVEDNRMAWNDGWWIGSLGLHSNGYGGVPVAKTLERITQLAANGNPFHIRALQHLALCKLLNLNPLPAGGP